MNNIETLREEYKYWDIIADQIDQSIDVMLNLSQSGHPGGSRSKVYVMVATLLSGVMKWDIRSPEKTFGDRFVLVAGHANPVVYATLAVFNEALRRKYNQTGDEKYNYPLGENFTLTWEDLLTLRKRGGLSGHAEMEGKTSFFKCNTGPSGHGSPIAAGEAFALKYAGADDVRVFAFEGEGGLTTGVTHETKNSAYGLGLGNLIYVVDWNDYGIDDRPFSDVMAGTPKDWFEPYGWKVAGTENGEDWDSIVQAYAELLENDDTNQPKALWLKMRKGRGYKKYDNVSHGAPHKRNSSEFWETKREFAEKYNLCFEDMDSPEFNNYEDDRAQMANVMDTVMSLFDIHPDLTDYLANRLVEIGESIPEHNEIKEVFKENPFDDSAITDFKNFPKTLYKQPGEKAPNRAGFGNYGSWLNSYCKEKYGRPVAIVSSADHAGSTNIAGFSKGWDTEKDFGMFNRNTNPKGTLLPQGITEFANAGIMCGISSVNFNSDSFKPFNGYITASSTYGSFSYLKYGIMRLYSQMAQDSQMQIGKTIWVAGHSGPETAEDSRTHFGIFAPGVTQLFPEDHIVNLHPWEYNEVPVMLAEAIKQDYPIIALHLTRPSVEIPDRKKLGIAHYFDSAKGAYIIKDYDNTKPKEGVVIVRGTSVISHLVKVLPELNNDGPNVKIVAGLSWGLFNRQTDEYKESIVSENEWLDAMIITNTSLNMMQHWIKHPIVRKYSLSADWDNKWRSGGSLEEVIDEAHLSGEWQIKAINRLANERKNRLNEIHNSLPVELTEPIMG